MSAIDLIILGIIREQPQSAYDLQKEVKYRNISNCVKISAPSIYKKVLRFSNNGFIYSEISKEGNAPEKSIYSLTKKGVEYHQSLIQEVSISPVNLFLDMNSVIMNLSYYTHDEKIHYLNNIDSEISKLVEQISKNLESKENLPYTGKQILLQQLTLATSLQEWIKSMKESI